MERQNRQPIRSAQVEGTTFQIWKGEDLHADPNTIYISIFQGQYSRSVRVPYDHLKEFMKGAIE